MSNYLSCLLFCLHLSFFETSWIKIRIQAAIECGSESETLVCMLVTHPKTVSAKLIQSETIKKLAALHS
jgi:hypothetical protein